MRMINWLRSIRTVSQKRDSPMQIILWLLLVVAVGYGMGWSSEHLDYYSGAGSRRATDSFLQTGFAQGLCMLGNSFTIWMFFATLISVYSRHPLWASIRTGLFFAAVNSGYFRYETQHFGNIFGKQFVLWMALSLLAALAAAPVWYARGKGKASAIIAALPIAAIVADTAWFMYVFAHNERVFPSNIDRLFTTPPIVFCAFAVFFILFLLFHLSKEKEQRRRTGIFSCLFAPVFFAALFLFFKMLY